ncbi:aldo/keto reductase [Myceligenerans pegani]|uniref:Aldo/keto reductase n=1 Tax=Myceligenerans pegani TaxID=2776917 RepID=A0ABR9N190_9MICO|nr:aldo/keto reductase [Myceligenerans sp. TRM 65318]MBE1877430.1 aldo/keto reductase [Myceligenerans sp. TRM 65318]MBE3019701.1 aldo/keto reductase [Myceligenerans sp. TRM 65318]
MSSAAEPTEPAAPIDPTAPADPTAPLSPRSTLALPALGYGAANIGNLHRALTDEQAHEVLEAAWEAGIRYFDTAPHYGLGWSERRLGDFLRTRPRAEYVVSTKAGRLLVPDPDGADRLDLDHDFHVPAASRRQWDFSADGVRRSLEESLERMGLDRVDLLYLHDPERHDLDRDLETGTAALATLKDEGLIGASGLGSMSTAALERGARGGGLDVLMVAGRLTLAEQPALAAVVPECSRTGTAIVTASVFNSGILASDDPGADARYEYGAVPPELLARVRRIAAICREFGVPLPAAALQYTRRVGPVVSVVAGSSRPEQIRQNAEWMALAIPEELWGALAEQRLVPGPAVP